MSILSKLGGRKFLMALFGALAIALQNHLGINPDSVLAIGGIVCAYVFGEGLVDKARAENTPKTDDVPESVR